MGRARTLLDVAHSCQAAMQVYEAIYRRILPRGQSIFIASLPKTGSTFLISALREATGFKSPMLIYAYERNEQDLYLPALVDNQFRNTVNRFSTPATESNLALFDRFEIRPVILVRNLFDLVVSTRDHLRHEGRQNLPSFYATEHYDRMGEEEQHWFIITYAMPWYIQFYAGWYETWKTNRLETMWLRYEDCVRNWPGTIDRILRFHGIHKTSREIENAVRDSRSNRMAALRRNRVVSGRGLQQLSDAQCEYIRAMAWRYPDVSFSCVGIDDRAATDNVGPAA